MTKVVRTPHDFAEVFSANFNNGDLDALTANYTVDGTLDLGGQSILRGRSQIRKGLESFLALRLPIQTKQMRTIVNGDIAFVNMEFSIEGNAPDGNRVNMHGSSVDILKLGEDGIWRQYLDLPFGTSTT